MVTQPLRWFDDERELSPFLTALEDVRRKATREGWCYQHMQAILVSGFFSWVRFFTAPLRALFGDLLRFSMGANVAQRTGQGAASAA